jgi:hypothetical protein
MVAARRRRTRRIAETSWLGACVCLALLAGACGSGASAPTSTTTARIPSDYVNEILILMESQAVHRARIVWTDFRAQVTRSAQRAQSIPALYPAVSVALGMLEDGHGFYLAATGFTVGDPKVPAVPGAVGSDSCDTARHRLRADRILQQQRARCRQAVRRRPRDADPIATRQDWPFGSWTCGATGREHVADDRGHAGSRC